MLTLSTRKSLSTRHVVFLRFFSLGVTKLENIVKMTYLSFKNNRKTQELPKNEIFVNLFDTPILK